MTLGIRAKLFLVSVALVAACFATADAYLSRAIDRSLTASIRADLFVRARLAARDAAQERAPLGDVPAWDALADALGKAADARVTLVRADGVVLGDSELPPDAVRALENHVARPEIAAALRGGEGDGSRLSTTVGQRLLYVAVPFARDGRIVGVARVAQPLRAVDDAVARMRGLIAFASILALGIAVLASSLAAEWLSRGAREMTLAARRMTEGDLTARTRVTGNDELGELGRALDQLAASLSTTLEALRAERDLHARILEGMQEGVLVLDREGRVLLVNPALRAMLLLPPDSRGRLLLETVRHAELAELVTRARTGAKTAMGEIDLGGIKPRRLLVHATPLARGTEWLLAVFVDVTDLRRLESLRRDFVANVSHELRTPVTAVRSAAETLKGGALDDPAAARRFVEIIDRNAERLQSLIEDLLELSRIESREFRLKKERIDLPHVVALVLGLFREKAEKRGVALSADLAGDVPALTTDQRALEQVLSNLVDNAVKYCPAGSHVKVRVQADPRGLRVAVEDDGPGIAPQHLPRLFERFYRVDAGRSRDVGGTGLGLSIVKHLIEAMGGEVTVESAVGKGSTFAVTLPAVPAPRSSEAQIA